MSGEDKSDNEEITLQNEDSEETAKNKYVQSSQSQHFEYYSEQMQPYLKIVEESIGGIYSKLEAEGIQQNEGGKFVKHIEITAKSGSINRQAVVLHVRWGYFSMDISVLNQLHPNHKHGTEFSQGGFASIYVGTILKEKIAIKCIKVTSGIYRKRAVKEWFLAKIASAAEIGPKVMSSMGFDVLMYSDCVEFALEVCKPPTPNINSKVLYWNLAVLHRLGLVHLDIKPDNIMLSPAQRKTVFIDFGLSRPIPEPIGIKSFTRFVGTLSFCSEDMTRRYVQDDYELVDLYHNDLYCLRLSLKSIRETVQISYHQKQQIEQPALTDFNHLHIFCLSFCLFLHQVQRFSAQFDKLKKSQSVLKYLPSIFEFLLEMPPTRQFRQLFYQLVHEVQGDSFIYSKLKIVYEISLERLGSVKILLDQEKSTCFDEYLSQVVSNDSHSDRERQRKLLVPKLVFSPKLIAKVPFKEYASMYLEYMSYTNNKHEVNTLKREKAALVYHSIHISQHIQPHLKGRVVVEGTIRHLLSWFLAAKDIREDSNIFPLLTFRLLDFLIILDLGSPSKFIFWLDSMFNHKSLACCFKQLLVMRVLQAVKLNQKRWKKKAEMPRVHFVQLLRRWVCQHNNLFLQLKDQEDYIALQQIMLMRGEELQKTFSQQFLEEFGFQIIGYNRVEKEVRNRYELIDLFNQLSAGKEHMRFFYFLVSCFDEEYMNRNTQMSDKIYKIFLRNVADDSVSEDFSFSLEMRIAKDILCNNKSILSTQDLKNFIENVAKVQDEDLVLAKRVIIDVFSKVQILLYLTNNAHSQEIALFFNFLPKFVNSLEDHYLCQLFSQQEHQCLRPCDLFNFSTIVKAIPGRFAIFFSRCFDQRKLTSLSCMRCQAYLDYMKLISSIQNQLAEYTNLVRQNNQDEDITKQKLDIVFSTFTAIENKLRQQEDPSDSEVILAEFGLRFGQMICCLHENLELEYRGLRRYYEMISKYCYVEAYYKNQNNLCFALHKTLSILLKTNIGKFIHLLFLICDNLRNKHLLRDYYITEQECSVVFLALSDEERCSVFTSVRKVLKESDRCLYISVIYTCLFKIVESQKVQKMIAKTIFETVSLIHFHFQRLIMIRFYFKICQKLSAICSSQNYQGKVCKKWRPKEEKKNFRRWQYCTHRLVNLIISEENQSNYIFLSC